MVYRSAGAALQCCAGPRASGLSHNGDLAMSRIAVWSVVCLAIVSILYSGCTTGVEPSPHPGVIRVMLKSDDTDTALVILNDTTHFSRYDQFYAWVYGGRVYQGGNYSSIYANTSIQRIESDTVNLLAREWLNGVPINIRDSIPITPQNSRYSNFVIFEWYLPPGTYDNLEFSFVATEVQTYLPKLYSNPVQLAPGDQPQMFFPVSIPIQEDKVTEVDLVISPFKSLSRYQDSFLFARKMWVAGVKTY